MRGGMLTLGGISNFLNNRTTSTTLNTGGGAIYFASTGVNKIANTGTLTFKGNSSASNGGAIYSNGNLEITKVVTFGGTGASDGNTSTSYGGAIYFGATAATLTLGDTASFINNKATSTSTGNGGAIYFASTGVNKIANTGTLTFKGNSSASNGGAIYSNGDLSLEAGGNTIFTGNLVSTSGGAIYLKGSTLSLHAKTGDISFSGNKMGANLTAPDPSATGTANSAYLNVSSSVYLAATNGKTVTLSDPIKATASTTHTVSINKLEDGTITAGKVVFSGANYAANSADIKSNIAASTTVYGGTFSVVKNAQYGTATSTLATNSGAKLMGDGYVLGTTTMYSGSTLSVGDSASGTITLDNLSINGGALLEIENGDLINILGTLYLSGASILDKILVDLSGFGIQIDDYKIIDMANFEFSDGNLNNYFDFQGKFSGDIYALGDAIYINGTVIPEPSAYATIFALLALGFAIYRRRK